MSTAENRRKHRRWARVTPEQRGLIAEWDRQVRALGNQKSFAAKVGVPRATLQYIIRDIREDEHNAAARQLQ